MGETEQQMNPYTSTREPTMARNTDAHLLRHSRILSNLRKTWARAIANQANNDFIAMLETEMDKYEQALINPTEQPTIRLEKRW
jgi:hypothetical protein